MKRKIKKYLNSKNKNEYNELDRVFEMYVNGEIKKQLSKYSHVGIFPCFNKNDKVIQLSYHYNNIYVILDFFENGYSVTIYPAGTSDDDIVDLTVDYQYSSVFDFRALIKDIDAKIKSHPKLKDTTSSKRKKAYTFIAWSCFCLPVVIGGSIATYVMITEKTIQLNGWWVMCFLVLPLTLWYIFDIKSKRIK